MAQDIGIEFKVAALRQPAMYPDHPEKVEVIETHMSWIFLTERSAYKLKKPVRYDRLDFSTLEARRFYCMEELRLNRRLAASVYIDVIALRLDQVRTLHLGGTGKVVDWLVRMRRLPSHLMLDRMLHEGTASADHLRCLAKLLADFYRGLPPSLIDPAQYLYRLRCEVDDYECALCDPAFGLPAVEVRQLCAQQRSVLLKHPEMFEARVKAGKVIEGHGDLRPEHIYLGDPIAIIDCLEFSAELRTLDIVDELGFLALECESLGAPQLGRALFDAYHERANDAPDDAVIHFYQSFRACVRAKIAIWHLKELRYRDSSKWSARARHYLQIAAQHIQSCESALQGEGDSYASNS
jgi:aminoglycoside phosphotransferase family enzyme